MAQNNQPMNQLDPSGDDNFQTGGSGLAQSFMLQNSNTLPFSTSQNINMDDNPSNSRNMAMGVSASERNFMPPAAPQSRPKPAPDMPDDFLFLPPSLPEHSVLANLDSNDILPMGRSLNNNIIAMSCPNNDAGLSEMGRSPTVFSIMSGIDDTTGKVPANRMSSRATATRTALPPRNSGFRCVEEEEDEDDEDEDEDEDDDEDEYENDDDDDLPFALKLGN